MNDPLSVIEDRLAERGYAPRRRGEKIIARCPSHEDRSPSLDITRGTKQPLVITCRAGCATENVLKALDLTWADVSVPLERIEPVVTARYPYRDEHGELLYTVERREPGSNGQTKSFRQVPASGRSGAGAMEGVRRVPYRLPEIMKAASEGKPVWICEGEKDADALVKLGKEATTNAGGAGNWTAAWNAWIEGAHVKICVDRDAPGYKRGADIAKSLQQLNFAKVVIFEPIEGNDVSDHLAAGHAVNKLKPISVDDCIRFAAEADTQPANTPAIDNDEHAQRIAARVQHLLSQRIDFATAWHKERAPEWLIEPFIAVGAAHALYAEAKKGKSAFALAAVANAVRGAATLGTPLADGPIKVVYVDMEMSEAVVMDRLREMGYDDSEMFEHLCYNALSDYKPLDTAEGGEILVEVAKAWGAKLVVIDTLSRVISGEENSADTFRNLYMHCIRPLKSAGIATLRLDHAGKDAAKGQRGSSAKNDDVDIVYRLERTDEGSKLIATHRRFDWVPESSSFIRTDDPVDFLVTLESVPPGTRELMDLLDTLDAPIDASVRAAGAILRGAGHTARQSVLAAALKARRRTGRPMTLSDPDDELI